MAVENKEYFRLNANGRDARDCTIDNGTTMISG